MTQQEFDQLQKLVKQNLHATRELERAVAKMKKYLTWLRVVSIIKLVLILAPIVLALIYLPPIISNIISEYKAMFNGFGGGTAGFSQDILNGLLGK